MSDIPTRAVPTRGTSNTEPPAAPAITLAQQSDAEAKLSLFVNSQIEKMQNYVKFAAGRDPTFYEVNEALMTYQDTNLALLALHNTAKMEHLKAKERFEDWFASKYIHIRDRENPRNLPAQKWYGAKEIEMMVRKEYPEDFHRYNWDIIITEQQLSFIRRLLEGWASYQYILTQLSKNLISEMNGLGVESALDRAAGNSNL